NVLKSCSRYRRPFLLTSTSEVYGKGSKVPFCEDDDTVMGPTSKRRWSYACAKGLDEFLALAYWVEARLPVVIARLFNTVGPRQTGQYGMVVPAFVRQALRGEPITVFGDGQQSRCFAHVEDVVGALVRLQDSPTARGHVVNIGNNEEISIEGLAKRVKELTASASEIRYIPYAEAYGEGFDDMQRRVPSLERAGALIGYRPARSLDAILRDVIEYEKGVMS
ncbi:MAG: NAD-dependent epimerase/dehydratase family protein, partial [Lentisphaerae bacterium]|nr:NAD-dependent epimerase/dehydratase family protein [Lentisphaerota bacterium]